MRLTKRLAALVAVPALALALGLGSAGAAFASDNANVNTLYQNNYKCGGAGGTGGSTAAADAQGFVNAHLDGSTLTLVYHIKDGSPSNTYYIYLYENNCTYVNFLGTITTNSNGVGNATFTQAVDPTAADFWTLSFYYPFVYPKSGVESQEFTP